MHKVHTLITQDKCKKDTKERNEQKYKIHRRTSKASMRKRKGKIIKPETVNHRNIHSGDFKYECLFYNMKFLNKHHQSIHERFHSKIYEIACSQSPYEIRTWQKVHGLYSNKSTWVTFYQKHIIAG